MPLAWVSCAGSRFLETNHEFVQSNECEGSCGAFKTREEAETHARNDGYAIAQDEAPDGVLAMSVKRGLYAIIYGNNGATAHEVAAARAWLRLQGIEPS